MDRIELSSFKNELEKNAFIGKILKGVFSAAKKKTLKERAGIAGKSLLGGGLITGAIGAGGLAYGAISQPRSIRSTHPGRFKY